MADWTVKTCRVMLLLSSLSLACTAVSGEIVSVHTERPFRACSLPRTLDVTITQAWEEGDDIHLHLKINDVIKVPHSVVLMTDDVDTGETKYQSTEISQTNMAYHSYEHDACISVHCSQDKGTGTPFYVLEGTFFHNGVNKRLAKKNDDVVIGRHYVTAVYILEEVENLSDPITYDSVLLEDEDGGIPAWFRPQNDQRMDSGQQERVRRSVTNYYLDILPVVDYHLYERWLTRFNRSPSQAIQAITTYLTNVFTSVSLRFNTLKLRGNIVLDVRMLTPVISTSEGTSKFTENNKIDTGTGIVYVNMKNQIKDFKEWISTNTNLPDNDHVMLFTGYRWYTHEIDGRVIIVKGLAWQSTFCHPYGSSSSVVQDLMGYQCEGTAAHELGHSLGAVHDSQSNMCPISDRHVMAPKSTRGQPLSSMLQTFSFSKCSSSEISSHLELIKSIPKLLSTCLLKAHGADLPDTPTTSYDILHLCPTINGKYSSFCYSNQSYPGNKDFVCTSVMCAKSEVYCESLVPPSGTCCGHGKYCVQGVCSPAPAGMCAKTVSPVG